MLASVRGRLLQTTMSGGLATLGPRMLTLPAREARRGKIRGPLAETEQKTITDSDFWQFLARQARWMESPESSMPPLST